MMRSRSRSSFSVVYLVQRIITNSYGWTRPSPGRLGPLGEGEYVRENGFGHEDWNFSLDFAIREHVYGYAYYEPSAAKAADQFQIAFVTYAGHRWRLVGFYLDAEFITDGAPTNKTLLKGKLKDLLVLKSANSLGKPWAGLDAAEITRKLKDEARWLRWRVHVKNAIPLPQPAAIPERLFKSENYRITRPTEVNAAKFRALRALASRTALPEEDDEAGFPEGREVLLQHKARERNPAVVQAAKAKFLQKQGKFVCQACGFDFEDFYGPVGGGFIEAHHTTPVSELRAGSKTRAADIALVCSNCHRMLHRRRPWITMSDLKTLLTSQSAIS
jgi:predicted HNH restriction endonuclease